MQGTGDDNVHYQSREKPVNALVAANKRFTMACPNQSHGISKGEGTSLHLSDLMTDYLARNLPQDHGRTDYLRCERARATDALRFFEALTGIATLGLACGRDTAVVPDSRIRAALATQWSRNSSTTRERWRRVR